MDEDHQKVIILLILGLIVLFAFNFSGEEVDREVMTKPPVITNMNSDYTQTDDRFEVVEEEENDNFDILT